MKKVDNVTFVTAWQRCNSISEVRKMIGLTDASIRQRAMRLVKKGVNLKVLSQGYMVDVPALNNVIASPQDSVKSEVGS